MTLGRTLMVQGTSSSVGKSLLVAALCRIFRRAGISVAPFKAQNMALNAAVTHDGFEIGRAQALQAEAAGLLPRVEMNPVLLKPEGDSRCQVVRMGRPIGRLTAKEYYAGGVASLETAIAESLTTLRREHELVIIEGAGSPAELNLQHRDLANMHVARLASAPVLLVGDIDRGGVFASLLGTLALLDPADRARVVALVVNKFRGDPDLFTDGVEILQQRSGKPVLGVVPHIADLRLADEDSMSLDARTAHAPSPDVLDIVVVRFPRIANFDDVLPLEREPGVCVRFVTSAEAIARADFVIVPGSKSTVADLHWLHAKGFAQALCQRALRGAPILGICGGCQMLGEAIEDPERIEADVALTAGLALLPLRTRYLPTKRTTRATARRLATDRRNVLTSGMPHAHAVHGYEIHHGETRRTDHGAGLFVLQRAGGEQIIDGGVSLDGNVVGTMLHGLFDDDLLRASLLHALRARRALPDAPRVQTPSNASELDRLADAVSASLDIARLRSLAAV